jgi:hypothetical protein
MFGFQQSLCSYGLPATSTFLSEQTNTSYQQPTNGTSLSEQISASRPPDD